MLQIDKVKKNTVLSKILKNISTNDIVSGQNHSFPVSFSMDEVNSLSTVAFYVYNAFCNGVEEEDDGFTPEINQFLDGLYSAIKKMDEAC
jgi:hypothetical protein